MNQNAPSPSTEESDLTKRTREWMLSGEGKEALARAMERSDGFRKRLNEMSHPAGYVDRTVIDI